MGDTTYYFTENSPLWKVRAIVLKAREDGIVCPCCNQLAKVYTRKLNSGMAYDLIRVVNYLENNPDEDSIHIAKFFPTKGRYASELSKLQYWGFVAPKEGSGLWGVTKAGIAFAHKKIKTHREIVLFDTHFLGFSGDEINIVDALNSKFDYKELMAARPTTPE